MKRWLFLLFVMMSFSELAAQKALIVYHSGDSTYWRNDIVQGLSTTLLLGKFRSYDLTRIDEIRFYESVSAEVQNYFGKMGIPIKINQKFGDKDDGYFLSVDSVYFDPLQPKD